MYSKLESKSVSIVIPMYNSESTIIRTLESVKNQTAFNLISEIIIVNDGSTDNSLDIVLKYSNENRGMNIKIINKANGGVSSARNVAMKEAKSEYIALLDSDDEWLSNKIEIQMRTFQMYPEIDFLGGDYNGKSLYILFKKIDKLYKATVKDLCIKFFPVTPSAIFKRKIVEEIGFFDEKQEYAEDGNYFLKICAKYNYYHLPVQMVICGLGKQEFGVSGLSANLKEMYAGNVKNIKELKKDSIISNKFYLFLRIFYGIKYIRRIIITKMRSIFNK